MLEGDACHFARFSQLHSMQMSRKHAVLLIGTLQGTNVVSCCLLLKAFNILIHPMNGDGNLDWPCETLGMSATMALSSGASSFRGYEGAAEDCSASYYCIETVSRYANS